MKEGNFTSGEVIKQLERILSAEVFINSNALSRFLRFVVEETLAGNATQLKEYTIGINVLSKTSRFSPKVDPIVRIHAGRLRRALYEYYATGGKNDPVVISIPKGSYVPVFSEWISSDNTEQNSNQPEIIVRKKPSVAVLPFKNNSIDAEAVFFADGLGDQISTELASYPDLSVISYYSCRSIADKVVDIKEAGLLLDAKYILTGTVQSDSNQLRVRVQLVLSETREQLWANSYERKNTVHDFFEIQDEIVWKVINQTAGQFGAILRHASNLLYKNSIDDLKVFDAIFWYYHFVNDIKEDIYKRSIAALQYSVKVDPGYALGWAVLGEIYVAGFFMGYKTDNVENVIEEGLKCGKTALKIDPLCQHAYQTIALANLFLQNKPECMKAINDWSNIKPGAAGIMGGIGACLIFAGEYERGMKLLDDSVHLNPYYQWWLNGGISFYYFKNEAYEDAIYWAEKMNMPHVPWELLIKTAAFSELNNIDEAKQCATQLRQRFPYIDNIMEAYLNAFLFDKTLTKKIYTAILNVQIYCLSESKTGVIQLQL